MMDSHPADRFIAGFLAAAFMTVVLNVVAAAGVADRFVPLFLKTSDIWRLLVPSGWAACLVLPGPLLDRFLPCLRRRSSLCDEDVKALLLGRVFGLVAGVIAAVVLMDDLGM